MSFSRKPVLTGERAVLRPFTEDDAPVMARILADPEVLRLTGSPTDGFEPDRLRSWYGSRNDHADRLDLGIVDRASGELVGEAVLNMGVPPVRAKPRTGGGTRSIAAAVSAS
jgi:RimJ/RimL family protein N-acetyltransferase